MANQDLHPWKELYIVLRTKENYHWDVPFRTIYNYNCKAQQFCILDHLTTPHSNPLSL